MTSLCSPAPVLRSILRSLLSDEYALYLATRDACRTSSGPGRVVLETQAHRLDSDLMRLAWQLGCWGEPALVGATAPADDSLVHPERPPAAGTSVLQRLGQLHAGLIREVHRFIARTNRFGDHALDRLLADLLAGHTGAMAALRQDDALARNGAA